MRNIAIGFFLGGLVVAGVAASLRSMSAEPRLLDSWRKVQPGMNLEEVESLLGSPSSQFSPGDGFPEFARRSVPKDYFKKHGLVTYVIPTIRPQVLLIYLDEEDSVVFVSSAPT